MSQVVQSEVISDFTGELFTPVFDCRYANGLSVVISAQRTDGSDDLQYKLKGFVEANGGDKHWVRIDEGTIQPADLDTPDGIISALGSAVLQDAYGRYDGVVLQFESEATYNIFVSVRREGAGYRGV